MSGKKFSLAGGAVWAAGSHAISQTLRLGANVVLARLLAPELFGVMVIVNTLNQGAQLLSDVGVGQNIVHNKNGEKPAFYNTAWIVQAARGLILWVACLAAAPAVAHFYGQDVLAPVLAIVSFNLVLMGFASTSLFVVQKRLHVAKTALFDISVAVVSAVSHIALALITPTIWALAFGGLAPNIYRMAVSHFLIKEIRNRFMFSREHFFEIISFGKWIFFASLIQFLSMNFDRLYFSTVVPLALLGVYGIARSFSEIAVVLVQRLGNHLIFPLLAASSDTPREQLRANLAAPRRRFLTIAAVALCSFALIADVLIGVLYDDRYQNAAWMLPLLLIGVWFALISQVVEWTLMGFGKPIYGTIGRGLKLTYLIIGLPIGIAQGGLAGAIVALATSDLPRYIPLVVGQIRERFSFIRQDMLATLGAATLFIGLIALRSSLGLGSPLDGVSFAVGADFAFADFASTPPGE